MSRLSRRLVRAAVNGEEPCSVSMAGTLPQVRPLGSDRVQREGGRFRAWAALATLWFVTVALKKRSNAELLEEVARLSERMTGEVVDGELYVMGRPTPGHQNVEGEVTGALRFGGGGRPPPVG